MSRNSFKPRPAGSLKDATDDLVSQVGGLGRAAELSRVSRSTLGRYTDHAETDRYMPVDVVRALEARLDHPVVTAFLAHEAGYRIAAIQGAAEAALPGQIAHAAQEMADVVQKGCEALADGEITPGEAGDWIKEIDDVFAVLQNMRAGLREIAGGEL